jgi:DNA-binding CsgD family transcriptional regulator
MRPEWPLIGRDDELQFVVAALGGTTAGGGVVLVGPAGVGKTRLAAEAMRSDRIAGLPSAWVTATAATSDVPFGALAALIADSLSSTTDRLHVLARGCRALANLAGDGSRLLLLVDDAHLLDPLSCALVHQAVSSGSVLLVATIRRGAPVPHELTALWKDGLIERLEIAGLSRAEMERLAGLVLGGPLHGATVHRLWQLTEGNTLFLREVIETTIASGALTERDGIWRLAADIKLGDRLDDLVALRLGTLTPAQERVIEHVAIAEPVDADLITTITAAADIEEAESTGAITAFHQGDRLRLRMAHPLYGEAIRARIPALRAQRIHGGLADALDARGVLGPDELLAMVTWRLESGGRCPPELLLHAGRQARIRFDFTRAERLAAAALASGGGVGAATARAEYLYLAGRFEEAEAVLAAVDASGLDDRDRANLAVTRASNLMWGLGAFDSARRLLTLVTESIRDEHAIDDLNALHARVALAGAELHDVLTLTHRVVCRSEASELARLSAVVGRAPALALAGRTEEAIALLDEYRPVALAHLGDYPQGIGMIYISQVSAHWFAGNLEMAASVATELYDLGVAFESWEAICTGARSRAWVELALGRPRSAMRWANEAKAAVPEGDTNGLACWCQSVLAEASAVANDPGVDVALSDMAAMRHPWIRVYDAQLTLAEAWAAATAGETSRAVELLATAAAESRALGAHAVESHLLHNIVRLGRPDRVVERLGELIDVVDGRWSPLFYDHATALTRHDPAGLHRVAEAFARLGATLLAAEAELEASRAHRQHARESSRRAAATRAARWAAACEGARTPSLAVPESVVPLTRRENEIAALAGQGLSSSEIARRLTVSTRTVEGHLYRLYAKLGVNRRQDLAEHHSA